MDGTNFGLKRTKFWNGVGFFKKCLTLYLGIRCKLPAMNVNSNKTYSIGQLAKEASVNTQTIRYYEREGILKPINRSDSGYREYDKDCLKKLRFIIQAKELGFSLKEINELLNLRISSVQKCNQVRRKAEKKYDEVKSKIKSLKFLEKTLKSLIDDCKSHTVSDCCPIIEKLEH